MYYVTKYALTKGIIEFKDFEASVGPRGFLSIKGKWSRYSKKEYFTNKEEAIKDCEERKIKKLQSLEKQIKEISKLEFK